MTMYHKVASVMCAIAFCISFPAICQTPVSVEELSRNPSAYDGMSVSVKGYVVITPHGKNIFPSRAAYVSRNGACLGLLAASPFFNKMRKRKETVVGTFRKALCGPNDVCLYWCNEAGIEVAK